MDISFFLESTWYEQGVVIAILAIGLILFLKDNLRYDVVAVLLMMAIIISGVLPYTDAFANFGHPTIIVVGSMFIMSNALVHSGIVDAIVSRVTFLYRRPVLSLAFLTILVTILSGFVNNVGALAIVMPIALHLAQKSNTPVAFFLLPLAFASHLGGYLTLIGTPRNILISDFRAAALEATTGVYTPFAMFDFTFVGGGIAIIGVVFLVVYSWRYIPRHRTHNEQTNFAREYLTEILVTPDSKKVLYLDVAKFEHKVKHQATIVTILRNNAPLNFTPGTLIHEDDVICLRGTEEALTLITEKFRLQLTGLRALERYVTNHDEYISIEVVIPPYSKIVGKSWNDIPLKERFGTNFIGLFRRTFTPKRPLSECRFVSNDIILLQGRRDSVVSTINSLSLIPLANEEVRLGRTTTIISTIGIIIATITLASLQVAPLALLFLGAVMALIGLNLVSLRQAYESIDWSVLVLLAGMITLGDALIASGAADTLARGVVAISQVTSPVTILLIVLLATMLISDFINTTAAAVMMSPIAITIALSLGVSIDPFLIAVAIGASSAFLTPVGHESNALVMQRGGYRFSDFTRMGLPLEIIIALISVPLILYAWPL